MWAVGLSTARKEASSSDSRVADISNPRSPAIDCETSRPPPELLPGSLLPAGFGCRPARCLANSVLISFARRLARGNPKLVDVGRLRTRARGGAVHDRAPARCIRLPQAETGLSISS